MDKKYIFIRLLGVFLLSAIALGTVIAAKTQTSYTFGIVPQQAASKLARLWSPILQRISAETGYQIHFKTAPSIPEFDQRLAHEKYDMAYMNPRHYTVHHKKSGYTAFARQTNKKLQGIIVTRKDSQITEPIELDDMTLAFPAPTAFASGILPMNYLKLKNVTFTPRYVSSHDSVYRGVAAGIYLAGGGIKRTFNNLNITIRNRLQILWESKPYTPHAFAAHPRIKPAHLQKIAQAFISLNQDEEGKKLLSAINFKGIQTATDTDWDDVRALKIDALK